MAEGRATARAGNISSRAAGVRCCSCRSDVAPDPPPNRWNFKTILRTKR